MLDIITRLDHDNLKTSLDSGPVQITDIAAIESSVLQLKQGLPFATVFYSMKANPTQEVLKAVLQHAEGVEVVSRQELLGALEAGFKPENILYGNPAKLDEDIAFARSKGVNIFVADSKDGVDCLAKNAPGAKLLVRIATKPSEGMEFNFSQRFGCNPDNAEDLIYYAKDKGLNPMGISFSIGSQVVDKTAWNQPIESAAKIWKAVNGSGKGIKLEILDIGGGYPSTDNPDFYKEIGSEVLKTIEENFDKNDLPKQIIMEPGRSAVVRGGYTLAKVIDVKPHPWDVGKQIVTLTAGGITNGLSEEGLNMDMIFFKSDGSKFVPFSSSPETVPAELFGQACTLEDHIPSRVLKGGSMVPRGLESAAQGVYVAFKGTGAYCGQQSQKLCQLPNSAQIQLR